MMAGFTIKYGPRLALKDVSVLPIVNGDGTHRIERRVDGVLTWLLPRVRIDAHDAALVEAGATEGFHGDFEIVEDDLPELYTAEEIEALRVGKRAAQEKARAAIVRRRAGK